MYTTYEVHVIKQANDTEVINDLPLELAYAMAAAKHGVVVERLHYEFDEPTVPAPRNGQ